MGQDVMCEADLMSNQETLMEISFEKYLCSRKSGITRLKTRPRFAYLLHRYLDVYLLSP